MGRARNKATKVKIIGSDGCNWSIDADRKNVCEVVGNLNNCEITSNAILSDKILFVWYSQVRERGYLWHKLFSLLFRKEIIAVATNSLMDHQETFEKVSPHVHTWISPNEQNSSFLEKRNAKYLQIPFIVSRDEFYSLGLSREELCQQLAFNVNQLQGKLLIGSFQRDTALADINQPKWHKNPDVLVEICKLLPRDSFCLVLAGPRRHYLISRCIEERIPYVFYGDETYHQRKEDDLLENNQPSRIVNLLYNLIDVYIVTSKSEGGPKAVLESALTKTMIFSTPVGLAEDMLCPESIFREEALEELRHALGKSPWSDAVQANYESVAKSQEAIPEKYAKMLSLA